MTEPAAPTRTEPVLDNVTRADQSDELATTTLLRAAIGPVNTNYYLGIFSRFDAQDKASPSWNTAAALCTLNWMLFRRMWNAALAYTGIALTVALLVFGIGKLALHYSSEVQWALAAVYVLTLVAIPGLFGNALLFRQYRRDMAQSLAAHSELSESAAMLAARAPSRKRLMVLAGINVAALAIVAIVVQWASDFNGLPATLDTSGANATAVTGNVAAGRAVDASAAHPAPGLRASAPTAPASTVQAAASAVQAATSAPMVAASAAHAPVATASVPTVAASTPTATKAASAPQAPAQSAPTPAPNAGRGGVQPPVPTAKTAEKPGKVEAAAKQPAQAAAQAQPKPSEAPRKPAATPANTPAAATATATDTPAPPAKGKASSTAQAGASKSAVAAGSYGINVGLFADPNNARNAFVKLSDAGLSVYTQEMNSKKGKRTWVRVGPFDSVAQAEKSVEKIQALGLDAQVFKHGQ